MRKRTAQMLFVFYLFVLGIADISFAQDTIQQILYNGSTDKRINIVFLSEGYTTAQLPRYITDARIKLDTLLNTSPYSAYRTYFNAFVISVASNDSGSDHPASNSNRNTYFNSTYDSTGLQHLITIDAEGYKKKDSLLQRYRPDYDIVIMIVNDSLYGGSGGTIAITSVNSASAEIVLHELGHSFAKLGDEYSTSYPGYPDTEEPNTTRDTIRNSIKWHSWILSGTPLPTPLNGYNAVVGLFEGAHYHSTGWYRPKLDCKMRTLTVPYCEVCSEAIVKSIYSLVRPIESYLSTSLVDSIRDSQSIQLSVVKKNPTSNNLSVQWFVDGIQKNGATSDILNVSGSGLGIGQHTVKVVVRDTTQFVRNDPGGLLRDSISWTVRVTDGAVPVELASFTATTQNTGVELHWATATESNNYGFEIERRVISVSANQWLKLDFVQGAGTSSSPQNYSFSDKNPAIGRYAYRLKQIDNNGTFKYSFSIEVSIETPKTFSLEQNYPNPFNPRTTIHYQLPTAQFVTLKIFDLLGKEVAVILSEQKDAGTYIKIWDASSYPSGIYFCRIQAGGYSALKKFVLLK
jgi:hypothetical protein